VAVDLSGALSFAELNLHEWYLVLDCRSHDEIICVHLLLFSCLVDSAGAPVKTSKNVIENNVAEVSFQYGV